MDVTEQSRIVYEYSQEILPNEILLEIFSYASVSELAKYSSVCKTWFTLTEDDKLWESLYNRRFTRKPDYDLKIGWKFAYLHMLLAKQKHHSCCALTSRHFFNLVIIGNSNCGKSTFIRSFLSGPKSSESLARLMGNSVENINSLSPSKFCTTKGHFATIDLSEIDLDKPMTKSLTSKMQMADAFIACFVVNQQSTLDSLKKWFSLVSPKVPIVLLACKTDLRDSNSISRQRSERICKEFGSKCTHAEFTYKAPVLAKYAVFNAVDMAVVDNGPSYPGYERIQMWRSYWW